MPSQTASSGSDHAANKAVEIPAVPDSNELPPIENNTSRPLPHQSDYGEAQIKVLEGLEAVRKRPGMYIGGTGVGALHHLVWEVVDNSIDEAMAGHASTVFVTVHPDGSCSVTDDGRGIPVGAMKHDDPALNGKSAVEIVLTKLHAGGKFGEEGSAYKVSGGLHGVGVSCVNALSDRLDCEVYRDGKIYSIGFERGLVTRPIEVVGPIPEKSTRKTGTRIVFSPDPEIFPDTEFRHEILVNRLRELAFLNPGVAIRLVDERVGPDGKIKSETFKAEKGLVEYVGHLMTGKTAVSSPVSIKREDAEALTSVEVAMQYHDGYNESLLTFANNINNVDGGTHGSGFKVALTRTINNYCRKAGILKEKDPVPTGEDLREGLVAIISVKLPNPTFNNQPKEKLLNPEIEGIVASAVSEALEAWLEEHPAEAKRLCQKGILAAQAREAARKARELTRRKTALESGSMPAKLKDCKSKGDDSEIFIVEGDSAGGSAGQGRDIERQAVLPLKGKILNVEKARIDQMLAFEEIRVLIQALRCGIGADFDISKLRYGKVVIMTDADVDGSHIRTLLLTFFFRQMPELIRRGRVYIAQPPLYKLAKGKKFRYVLSDRERDAVLTELGLDGSSLVIRAEDGSGREVRRLSSADSAKAVKLLGRLKELVTISERRGTRFVDLLRTRAQDPENKGRLPGYKVSWQGGEVFAWSEAQALALIDENNLQLADETAEEPEAEAETVDEGAQDESDAPAQPSAEIPAEVARPSAIVRELHENRELDRLFVELETIGLSIDTWGLVQEESVTGEKLPARYAWASDPAPGGSSAGASEDSEAVPAADSSRERMVEAANLPQILESLHALGKRGMEVTRFKGLGEMDAEQLWETTMDQSKRTLLRVTMEQAVEAEGLFTTLMGQQVEPRRKFIEDHALEVRNLDV